MQRKNIDALFAKCEGCGDDMIFDPESQSLKCHSCGRKKDIPKDGEYTKHDLNLLKENENNSLWAKEGKQMRCANCGASVILQGYHVSAKCPYCETDLVATKSGGNGMMPDAVIPFKFGKEKAEEIFKSKIKGNWFVPASLKKNLSADHIQAYYFPSFIFDADCNSTYKGVLYKDYPVKDKDGHSRYERRYFPVSGRISSVHNGLEIEASTKLSQTELSLVRPYNLTEAQVYKSEYIFGYPLECYSTSIKDCFSTAEAIMKKEIEELIVSKHNCDGVQTLRIDTSYTSKKYTYCVLPMYRINFKHKNTTYSNVMNGQTGVMAGKLPKSSWKITLVVLLPIIFVALIILLTLL